MNRNENIKGITLIALIITIIVLLILAGVSIAMLTGNNGILMQAKLAKENTALAKQDEENKLANNNEYINEQLGNVVPGKIVLETKKDNYVDINGDKATIPAGFSVAEKENIISNGMVVHGPDKANGDNGSEFVWIPVPDINSMAQCAKTDGNCNIQLDGDILKCKTHDDNEEIVGKLYATGIGKNYIDDNANATYSVDNGLREPAITENNSDIETDYNDDLFSLESLQAEYKNMIKQVIKYGGFYIGRYETSLSTATSESPGTSGTAQSKQGVIPTTASNSATPTWYGLYIKQNRIYAEINDSVESSMIWGSQYDAMLNWVKNGTNDEEKAKLTNTSLGNNSSKTVVTTGNENYLSDDINNIRDLGGNLREWTLEAYNSDGRVIRGGFSYYNLSPSYRFYYSPNNLYTSVGSRLSLYIK